MEDGIFLLIMKIQGGDSDALLAIINRFKPLIRKLSHKMMYEDAETDLIIHFILMLRTVDLKKFNKSYEGSVVNYIHISLKNFAIDSIKKYYCEKYETTYIDLDTIHGNCNDLDTDLFVNELLNLEDLTKR